MTSIPVASPRAPQIRHNKHKHGNVGRAFDKKDYKAVVLLCVFRVSFAKDIPRAYEHNPDERVVVIVIVGPSFTRITQNICGHT
jgi:hypothetical protein